MNKKAIIVSLFSLLLVLAASSTVFAADKYTVNKEGTIASGETKYVTDNWSWQKVGYGKDALTGSGKCNLKAADNVNVICEPASKSDNQWKIVSTELPEGVEAVKFDLYYFVEVNDIKGKPSYAYKVPITVTGKGVFDLNQFAYDEHTGYIKHVALGAAEKLVKTPKYKDIYKPNFEKVVKTGQRWVESEEYREWFENGDPIYKNFGSSITATNDVNNPIKVPNSNHFTIAKLDRASLEEGVTLDLIQGNKYDLIGQMFVQLVDGQIKITFDENSKVASFGAKAFDYLPTPDNGNIHSNGFGFSHDNSKLIDCPDGDMIYLYLHLEDYSTFTGEYKQIFKSGMIDTSHWEEYTYSYWKFTGWEFVKTIQIGYTSEWIKC